MSPTWHNHTGNQTGHPRALESPGSLAELVALVRRAEHEGTTVRAVGAGHAWSDVALTDGYLVRPDGLAGVLELDDGTLRGPPAAPPLVRVLGGTPLHTLNAALDARGLALPNMGGYDAQTIAGVVSTSTHGSGLAFGPFPELVRSLDLVVSGGEVVRVEPAGGLTDPDRFAAAHGAERRLIQDDGTFAAAVCAMGSMGLVHSLVLAVTQKFWLEEVRGVRAWEDVRDTLGVDDALAAAHYELFLNPYANEDGTHHALVTTRDPCPEPEDPSEGRGLRHPLTELEASLPVTGFVLRLLARWRPEVMARRFDSVLDDMQDRGFRAVSYEVFNIGEANHLPAYSMELGVALDGGRHVQAVDRILTIAAEQRRHGRVHTSPIALRFVAPSRAYVSMMYERETMMIELIMVAGSRHGEALLAAYESGLADLDVRPHWGQINALTPERVAHLYPRWADWRAVHGRFDPSGVFASPFTRRVGITAT